ncbi:MAG: hypothetical protein RLZZ450_3757 [Pseudomonadota bacterium]|jgi:hypothetical protein
MTRNAPERIKLVVGSLPAESQAEADAAPPVTTIRGHVIGALQTRTPEGWMVDYPDNVHGPLVARSLLAVSAECTDDADHLPVLLVFEHERSDRPIIVGVLDRADGPAQPQGSTTGPPSQDTSRELKVQIDGQRVVLEAQDEVVLRCGKSSITLRRNGRIIIRGSYVESDATGVNRVRGATVRLN